MEAEVYGLQNGHGIRFFLRVGTGSIFFSRIRIISISIWIQNFGLWEDSTCTSLPSKRIWEGVASGEKNCMGSILDGLSLSVSRMGNEAGFV